MTDACVGVAPLPSLEILSFMLRALRRRGAFDEALDPALDGLVTALGPIMPHDLLPDTYLFQPLVGDARPLAAFALDSYDRNYLSYHTGGAYFEESGIPARTEPSARALLCGLKADSQGLRPFVLDGRSSASRRLEDGDFADDMRANLGIQAHTVEAKLLDKLATLPVRVSPQGGASQPQLIITLPQTDPKTLFGGAPYRDALVETLADAGVDRWRLSTLERACTRQGIPCYSEHLGYSYWEVRADVSHFVLAFVGGRLASCAAVIRITDRSLAYLGRDVRPTRAYQWHITDDCDQRCKHCYLFAEDARKHCVTTPYDQLLGTLDEVEARCAQLQCMPALAVSGGDPLLHPRFWDFAEELHHRGFVWSLMGNPFHLSKQVCDRLYQLGCARYQLSLDGRRAFHDSLRKPGSFDATVAAVPLLKQAGIQVQLMATASRENLSDILACMDLAAELDADCFVFARYCATSPQKAIELYPTPEEYRAFLLSYYQRRRAFANAGVRCEFKLKEHLFCLLRYELGEFEIPQWSVEHPDTVCAGCHLGVSATIASNGDLLACRRMDSVVGNITNDHLVDVEEGEAMHAYRTVDRIVSCSECKLLMWCRGCRAVGFNATGDLQAADPMCWHCVRE